MRATPRRRAPRARRLGRLAAALAAAAALAPVPARADIVERRGAEGVLEGRVVAIDESGVSLRSELGAVHVVPWDRVRDVRMDRDDPRLPGRLETARALWRARSRLERNDTALAEPLFHRLFAEYRGQTNETALVVAEGLLRCLLARGDHVDALLPALEVTRLRRAGVSTGSYSMLRSVYDERLELCPYLAPAWPAEQGLERLRHDLAAYDAGGDEVVAAMARLYLLAVERQAGREPESATPQRRAEHEGLRLLEAAVGTGAGEPARRADERQFLERAVETWPAWTEAWARYCIGVSYLRESGLGRQQRGLINLAHLPARYAGSHWLLSGMALARMVAALETHDEPEAARRLRVELIRLFPGHPSSAALPSPSPPAAARPPSAERPPKESP